MRHPFHSGLAAAATLGAALALTACGTASPGGSVNTRDMFSPYKVDIIQGNFVSREQRQALRPGMSRVQVREILGTPLITSIFHADRWDYVFTIRRQKVDPQEFKLTVFFEGDQLARVEGDDLPAEAEFVDRIDTGKRVTKPPVLEATEEQLAKFPKPAPTPPKPTAPANPIPYPPLESR